MGSCRWSGTTKEEGSRLWIGVVENPTCPHAMGNISTRDPCPQAHHTQGSRQHLRTAQVLGLMTLTHCPGQMRWHRVITQTGHSPSKRIWNPTCTQPEGSGIPNWEKTPLASDGHEEDSDQSETPEPSLQDINKWVLGCAHWVETPSWWPELQEVPNQTDICQFARRVWAPFQMLKKRCHTSNTENDYLVLLTPHCIERDTFLLFNHMQFSSQDYCMKQPQKTLVYAKALQHWAGKPNHQCRASHASWWSVYGNLRRPWNC